MSKHTQQLRDALESVLERDGGSACACINHSRRAEREYESGTCPHQRARALLDAIAKAEGGKDE